jgi:hypothetical protein
MPFSHSKQSQQNLAGSHHFIVVSEEVKYNFGFGPRPSWTSQLGLSF